MVKRFKKLVEEIKLVKQVKISLYDWQQATNPYSRIGFVFRPVTLAVIVLLFVAFLVFLVSWGTGIESIILAVPLFLSFLGLLTLLYLLLSDAFYCIWCLLDFGFRPCLRCSGTIVRKEYHPTFTLLGTIGSFPAMPHYYTFPATYHLLIKIQSDDGRYSARQSLYDSVSVGDDVCVSYLTGRFSRQVYLQKVWK